MFGAPCWVDEHRLARALRTTGSGQLLERARSPWEHALSALVRDKPREAVLSAQRRLVDTVITGDWTGELEAAEFLADRYRASGERDLATVLYQRAGKHKALKELAAADSDTVLPLGELSNVPWWIARARAAQLEAQEDVVSDTEAVACLDDLRDLARQTFSGEIADSPQHSVCHQAVRSACALAPRGTPAQARDVLTTMATAAEAKTCLTICQAQPELALEAATKPFDLTSNGADDAAELLADEHMTALLTGTSQPALKDADMTSLRSRLVELATAGRHLTDIALSRGTRPSARADQRRAGPRPDPVQARSQPHHTAFGTRLVSDSFLVCRLDKARRQQCVDALMTIAAERGETADSRRDALTGILNLITELPAEYGKKVFHWVKDFVLGTQDGSHLDGEVTGTPHPLSSLRISLGPASLRGPALKLAQACAPDDGAQALVRDRAVALLQSDTRSDIYDAAITLTRLPASATHTIDPGLLAAHTDRRARQAGAILAARHADQHVDTIRNLAKDPDYTIRRTVAETAAHIANDTPLHPALLQALDLLAQDPHASVRRIALGVSRDAAGR
ncbi:hypothetical protein ACFWA6_07190 [Streptomyces sp. NPDC060020]|uniref:hypothetical protein n=1 Tax=Streptomyces sp. NPDC060020 TaxID=3347038 RepID=UPI0036B47F90